jgi:outer membrane immunogenic protein
MKRTVLTSVGCFFLSIATPAFSADLPMSMPMKAAPYIAPYYNWTGFYVGLNGGYGFGSSDWRAPVGATGGFDTSGGLVGGTIGYNFQTGALVWGIEGDFDWANIKGSTTGAFCFATCTTKDSWLGTGRLRLGYAFDRWLPYVTGGAAFGDVKAVSPVGSETTTKVGWTIGGGVEWAFLANWTAKAEYLYVDLGNGDCSGGCSAAPINVKFQTSLVRGGLNYRF